jgi:hypothetical protein
MNVKFPNNTSKWQIEFNSAFKGLNMLHTLRFFSLKCRLFHNATFFGLYIIHTLHTGWAKIWI